MSTHVVEWEARINNEPWRFAVRTDGAPTSRDFDHALALIRVELARLSRNRKDVSYRLTGLKAVDIIDLLPDLTQAREANDE